MEWRRDYMGGEAVETVYLGGGTPSLLSGDELRVIVDRIRALYPVAADAEWTLEANPDDIVQGDPAGEGVSGDRAGIRGGDRAKEWAAAGINRLSIGVQSFRDHDLRWMNRAHGAGQAVDSIKMAQDAGIVNISIDLIYGTPGLSDADWVENINKAVQLGIPHLSCYALTVEPKTALETMIRQHKKEAVSTDDQARQFLVLMDSLGGAGYEHYEISNFAIPGHRSRHNSSYWQGKPYLGLGPSAHSYDGGLVRQWNIANNALYVKALSSVEMTGLFEREVLTRDQQLNEYIMISLRTLEGCDLSVVGFRFGSDAAGGLRARADAHILRGEVVLEGTRLVLTREGKLLADGIASDLFV